ncbi:hypothetical protein EV363DRAFT_1433753 [Boletus edulis]|uniref:Uncharacterized protein n=1 Tax=Boletus edulis BED1 TaxID=1328754 RepID=A0AAD4BPZ8_BOLED|nr:hypothetical protein EV363DRAFT_1433753 [Boletus edulis]KAF8436811.1 hypothetical protein L210DRAFT_3547678 [Boletus edulis BED1]
MSVLTVPPLVISTIPGAGLAQRRECQFGRRSHDLDGACVRDTSVHLADFTSFQSRPVAGSSQCVRGEPSSEVRLAPV